MISLNIKQQTKNKFILYVLMNVDKTNFVFKLHIDKSKRSNTLE